MSRSTSSFITFLRKYWDDRRGAVAPLVVIFLMVLLGLTGLVVDFGHAYVVRRALQASTDAAALAGGYAIPTNNAVATAQQYSATAGNKNASAGFTATMVSGYPLLKCLDTTGVLCRGTERAGGANAIQVQQQAIIPTYFLRVLGRPTLTVRATATSGAKGGDGLPLNVMVVLDTTGSMNDTDPNCGLGSRSTKLDCAKAGMRALLQGLNPNVDYIGLITFPGIANASQASRYYTCNSSSTPSGQAYNKSPVYKILGLTGGNDYKLTSTSQTLNTGSNIVLAASGGGSGCTSGVSSNSGQGTYFAEAITAAQAELVAFAKPNTQNVIIVLSDGDASSDETRTDFQGYICGTSCGAFSGNAGINLTVTSINSSEAPLAPGQTITGSGVLAGTTIVRQVSGTTGRAGKYEVSVSQRVGSSSSSINMLAASTIDYGAGNKLGRHQQQCRQAVWAAQNAAAAGTWVYSVAYGATNSTSTTYCSTDTKTPAPAVTPCWTMRNIASSPGAIPDPTRFYSSTSCPGANTIANLVTVFKNISMDLTTPRLLPDGTT